MQETRILVFLGLHFSSIHAQNKLESATRKMRGLLVGVLVLCGLCLDDVHGIPAPSKPVTTAPIDSPSIRLKLGHTSEKEKLQHMEYAANNQNALEEKVSG